MINIMRSFFAHQVLTKYMIFERVALKPKQPLTFKISHSGNDILVAGEILIMFIFGMIEVFGFTSLFQEFLSPNMRNVRNQVLTARNIDSEPTCRCFFIFCAHIFSNLFQGCHALVERNTMRPVTI